MARWKDTLNSDDLENISLFMERDWDLPIILFVSANAPTIKFEEPSSVCTHICLTSYQKTTEAVCYKLPIEFPILERIGCRSYQCRRSWASVL